MPFLLKNVTLLCSVLCSVNDNLLRTTDYMYVNILMTVQLFHEKGHQSKKIIDKTTRHALSRVIENFREIEVDIGLEEAKVDENTTEDSFKELFFKNLEKLREFKSKLTKQRTDEFTEKLRRFVEDNYFDEVTECHEPEDFKEKPEFFDSIDDEELKRIAELLNNRWKELSRKDKDPIIDNVSSLITVKFPYVVPGGIFNEFFYWDTNWIIKGLLVCGMDETVKNMIKNYMQLIGTYGYIPNGTRKYFLNRSQPPYFIQMVQRLYAHDTEKFGEFVLREALQFAEIEHEYFMANKTVTVTTDSGTQHQLFYYHVETDFPRPEAFVEDTEFYFQKKDCDSNLLFSNFKTAAESGWDFGNRWLTTPNDLSTISIFSRIPVDLNAIMYKNELILADFYNVLEDSEKSEKYRKLAEDRAAAINAVLWNKDRMVWNDFDFETGQFTDNAVYFSNVLPLFYGVQLPENISKFQILLAAKQILFSHPGGIPASEGIPECNQQWDFPNVWAPHQDIAATYFLENDMEELALHVARSFYAAVSSVYSKKHDFYEKYDCENVTGIGGGGQYATQKGFGWTNGTILNFISIFKDRLVDPNYEFASSYAGVEEFINENLQSISSRGISEENPILVSTTS